jgi:hypothetical protein
MTEQSELTEVLLRILRKGILRIRGYAWAGSADLCAIEADHIHNLPSLISNPTLPLLSYYFDVSRVAFIEQARGTSGFEVDWNRLGILLSEMRQNSN